MDVVGHVRVRVEPRVTPGCQPEEMEFCSSARKVTGHTGRESGQGAPLGAGEANIYLALGQVRLEFGGDVWAQLVNLETISR